MTHTGATPQLPKIVFLSLLLYRWLLSMGPEGVSP